MRALLLPLLLVANWNDTPLGLDVTKLRQFPLERVLRSERDGSFDGIQVEVREERPTWEVRLHKTMPNGSWSMEFFNLHDIWKADLDGNGTTDYVFSNPGPYWIGRTTPVNSLTILLMEPNGMPVPYLTVMYDRKDNPALRHLVDLDRDGSAELIVSLYDEHPSDPRVGPMCSGHWVHHLYRFRNFAADEYRGPAGGLRFPIVHPWTYGPKGCVEHPGLPVEPAPMVDWGTTLGGRSSVVSGWKDGESIQIDPPVKGCIDIRPIVAVYDLPGRREIAYTAMNPERLIALLKRFREDRAQVELRGIRQGNPNRNECQVNLLWATRK